MFLQLDFHLLKQKSVFWDLISCLLVNSYEGFGEARFSKTMITIYQLTWQNIPEDLNLLSTPLRKPQILHCVVLYCIVLYDIILYCIISDCILTHPSWQNLYRTHLYNLYTHGHSYESSYLSLKIQHVKNYTDLQKFSFSSRKYPYHRQWYFPW